ncbi:PP2C family protein-serine/threonine phosphatase [candidate division KSB1 bacterium]|nr:PP2C family protein-serine/threonine phosphatase [candidate division KSB1 bacterium]
MGLENRLHQLYNTYTNDMTLKEMERLIRHEAPGVYKYYRRQMTQAGEGKNCVMRWLIFARNFFTAFLLKLSPARRIVYFVALLFFFQGLYVSNLLYIVLSFLLLNVLLAFELAEKLIVKDELEVARTIQTALMPKQAPRLPSFEIACYSEAAHEVGGDFYDFIQPNEKIGSTYMVIGDISGKGMAAALYMVQVQVLLHYLLQENAPPRDALLSLNKNLRDLFKADAFLTISLAEIMPSGIIHWCRAGHMPLLYYSRKAQQCLNITPNGMGIGLCNNNDFAKSLEETSISTQPGDLLIWFTDGVIENMNERKEEFGEERLKKVVEREANRSAQQIMQSITNMATTYRGSSLPHDDMSLVVMKAI